MIIIDHNYYNLGYYLGFHCAAPHMIKILRTLFLVKMCVMPHKKNLTYASSANNCAQLPHNTTQCRTVPHNATQCAQLPHNATQLPHSCTIIGTNFLLNTKYQTLY